MISCGLVLLAAGSSSRFGKPKQLLPYKGKSLIKHLADTALEAIDIVVVVTGSNAQRVEAELVDLPVKLFQNKDWEQGMATSIRGGLSTLLKLAPSTDSVIFMVCDQPFVSASLLREIIAKKAETNNLIIASGYGDTLGIPALFGKSLFPDLLNLKGDAGAKKIIKENGGSVSVVSFPLGDIDIDTEEDYKTLLQN